MEREVTTTEYIIDNITYIVTAYTSETATETLHKKVENLILRDMRRMAENPDKFKEK